MTKQGVTILAVESSCDETGVAIYHTQKGALSNQVFSQIEMHRAYGGVVPELAARDHLKRLPILYQQALHEAQMTAQDIDVIAYTAGPGLLGAVMTGGCFARALAYALGKPALAIHHMEGHLLSPLLDAERPDFPFLALLVSGGHTQILAVDGVGRYRLLGQTRDDAVGEAFDKTAKMMGLPYPGGPELAHLAEMGDPHKYAMPRPMLNRPDLDFSFSGLKTHVRLLIEAEKNSPQVRADIAASFQQAVVDTLVGKCRRAWQETGFRDLVVAGGVSANQALRAALSDCAQKNGKRVFFPKAQLCTDNALMIAFAAAHHLEKAQKDDLKVRIFARQSLSKE